MEKTERNEFDNALRDLALRHTPKQIAKCGEIVTAQCGGWKQPHKVKITEVSVEVSDIGLSIGRKAELGLAGWLIVQHQYIGRRLKANGELEEYIDPQRAADITPQGIENDKRLMDCIDCHNRATHIFRSPDELIDTALVQDKIDKSLPFIKREGMKALDPPNPSLAEAIAKIEAIREFYKTSYPQVYEEKGIVIDEALEELKEIARLTTFPHMQVSWKTYLDNLGHEAGCLRCHGKLVAVAGDQKGKAIDAGCESCHYLGLTP